MNDTHPTPYPDLNALLLDFVSSVRGVLEDRFLGAYLLGSFAMGDSDEFSDVDFAIATEDDGIEDRLAGLQEMHARLHAMDTPWAKHLDGSYIPRGILKRRDPTYTKLHYLDNGSRELVRSDHCNRLVIRWMVRERGIVLAGPDPKSLVDPIAIGDLRREISRDMRGWAAEIRADPAQMNNRHYQPYAVLSYCRMLYTLETGTITSKPIAAAWAKNALAGSWADLIERALRERADVFDRMKQRADPAELERTLAFIDYALEFADRER